MERDDIINELETRTGVSRAVLGAVPADRLQAYFKASAAPQPGESEVVTKLLVFIGALPCVQGDWILGLPIIAFGVATAMTARNKMKANQNLAQRIKSDCRPAALPS